MPFPAFIALSSGLAGLVFASLSFGLSSAPGWRALRWFAAAAVLASLFTVGDGITTFDVDPRWYVRGTGLNLLVAGLHGACWYRYAAEMRGRPLGRVERGLVVLAVALGALALVPGALLSDRIVARHVGWLGVTYRDVLPTRLGTLTAAYYSIGLAALGARLVREDRVGARAEGIALLALSVTAMHDTIVFATAAAWPYLLSLGFFGVIVGIGISVTTRVVVSARRLEASLFELHAAREALVQRERLAALGEMSAMMAHEVRNPLAVQFNALAALRRSPLGEEQSQLVDIMREEAVRLERLVGALLAFARPVELRREEVAVGPLVASAIESARASLGDLDAVVVRADTERAPPTFPLGEEMVRGALVNLLENALRSPGRRVVSVDARADEDSLVLTVADDGEGVADEARERLFRPFFTTRATGSGLGLAIVRKVAEAHGGEARLEPGAGPGARFTLRIPRGPSARPSL